MRGERIARQAIFAKQSVCLRKVGCSTFPSCHLTSLLILSLIANNAIELMDYGRESAELNYAHMIQLFHRFLVDHLIAEGNSFPRNPVLLPLSSVLDLNSPAPAPITQLLGIDAKNCIVCSNCKAVREKEHMTHIVEMIYPRKVSDCVKASVPSSLLKSFSDIC